MYPGNVAPFGQFDYPIAIFRSAKFQSEKPKRLAPVRTGLIVMPTNVVPLAYKLNFRLWVARLIINF